MSSWVIVVAIALVAAGCGGTTSQLKDRAAFDLGCKSGKIELTAINPGTYGAKGCGQRATYIRSCSGYVCTWVLNSDSSPEDSSWSPPPSSAGTVDHVIPKVIRRTLASQKAGARTLELESVGNDPAKVLRYTTVSGVRALRECKELAIVSGADRRSFAAKYRAKLYDTSMIFETMEVELSSAELASLATASEATLHACEQSLALSPDFLAGVRAAIPAPTVAGSAAPATLRARIALDGIVLLIQTDPRAAEQVIWLGALTTVRAPGDAPRCPFKLVRDGEPVDLGELEHTSTAEGEQYRAPISQELLEQLGAAQRIVGKVCEHRFQLEAAHVAELRNLVVRIREERALAQ